MNKEEPASYYDDIFNTGGYNNQYHKSPEQTQYHKLWTSCVDIIKEKNHKHVIDLGCGPGQFAELLSKDDSNIKYTGLDFSSKAIEIAKNRVSNTNFNFYIENLVTIDNYNKYIKDDTIYTSFEFLEHINDDLKVLNNIPKNSDIIFSVPNFDTRGHVRFFKNSEEVINRYSKLINILDVQQLNIMGNKVIYLCTGQKS